MGGVRSWEGGVRGEKCVRREGSVCQDTCTVYDIIMQYMLIFV